MIVNYLLAVWKKNQLSIPVKHWISRCLCLFLFSYFILLDVNDDYCLAIKNYYYCDLMIMMILITNTIFYWYWSMIFCFYISTHVTQHAYILQPIIIIFMIIAHDDDEKVVTLRQTDRKDWVKQKKSIDLSIDQHKHMSTWTHTHTGVNKMNEKINYINNRRSKNDEKNFTSFLNIIGEYITIKKKLKKTWRTNTQQTLTCWLKQEKQYQQVFQKKKDGANDFNS